MLAEFTRLRPIDPGASLPLWQRNFLINVAPAWISVTTMGRTLAYSFSFLPLADFETSAALLFIMSASVVCSRILAAASRTSRKT